MSDRQSGWAYDPIRDEDVQINCHPKHQSDAPEDIQGDELPVLIKSDFRHDPVEACQGTYAMIAEIDGGCPNCGYDRKKVTVHTLPGEHFEACRACGLDLEAAARSDDENPTPSKSRSKTDRIRDVSTRLGRTKKNGLAVYQQEAAPNLLHLMDNHDRRVAIHRDEATEALGIILDTFDRGEMSDTTSRWLLGKLADATLEEDAEEADDDD
jgi:hypothetical protein